MEVQALSNLGDRLRNTSTPWDQRLRILFEGIKSGQLQLTDKIWLGGQLLEATTGEDRTGYKDRVAWFEKQLSDWRNLHARN